MECPDGYTTPRSHSRRTRRDCLPCPHRYTCVGGERFSKISWRDDFCKVHNTRDTMFVPTVTKSESPQRIGEILSTTVRVQYDKVRYYISSIVQNGRTLEGGACEENVTHNSPVIVEMIADRGRLFNGEIQQYNAQLKVRNGSQLRFADCGRYEIQIGISVVESGVEEFSNVSALVQEFCSFELVIEHVNSPPEKREEYGSIDEPEHMEVFRGSAFDESFGDSLSPMFRDPDGQELTFTLSEEDRDGNEVPKHPFSIGACTGQLAVNDPLELLQTPNDEFKITVVVSDNYPDDPGELLQEVIVDVIQPNRPPRVSDNPPVLFIIEISPPGTRVTTLRDPAGANITTIVDPAFVTDPDGDEIEVFFEPCDRENYCDAFSLSLDGNLTVKDPYFVSFDRPLDLVRFVRVQYTDRKDDPVSALLELTVQQLRDAPEVTSTELEFPEIMDNGTKIAQLVAHDEHGSNFDFVVKKTKNNRGEPDDRISIASNGEITVKKDRSFHSILCADSFCTNCTEYDQWVDTTVTAQVLNRRDDLPGPIISVATKVRITVTSVNQPPKYNPPKSKVTVEEMKEDIEVTDISKFFCDREETAIFFDLGTPASKFAEQFSLSSSGVLQVSDAFDYETIQQVNVPIVVQDTGSPSQDRKETFTIYIVDVPEPPILDPDDNVLQVKELTTHKYGPFGNLTVKDPDIFAGTDKPFASEKSEYRFVQNTQTDKFVLRDDGFVSIREGYVPNYEPLYLDQDGDASIPLEFTVVDVVNNITAEFSVNIEIFDVPEPPYFDPPMQNFTVNVFSAPGDTLGQVEATSPDLDDPVDVVLEENPRKLSDNVQAPFKLSLARNGELVIAAGNQSTFNLTDDDVGTWYAFYVSAKDSHGLNITGRHFIEVMNEPIQPEWVEPFNDDENEYEVYIEIDEHSPGTLKEFQPDCFDPNERGVRYQLLDITPRVFDDIFGFDRDSGKLSVEEPDLLDYEPLYRADNLEATFEIACLDSVALQANVIGQVHVAVQDIPEPPKFMDVSSKLEVSVKEDVREGHFVQTISAFDQDFDSQFQLEFTLTSNEEDGELPIAMTDPVFKDSGHTGTINLTVTTDLDFYRKSFYDLTLVVEDETSKTDELELQVEVIFVNTPPVFDNTSYIISAFEDVSSEDVLAVGEKAFPFYDRNRDTSHSFTVTWSDPPGLLNFVSNGLRLVDGQSINYETIWFHYFGVLVTDSEGLSDQVNVTLLVKNVNDIKIDQMVFSAHSTMGGSITTLVGKDVGPIWRYADVSATIVSPGNEMLLSSSCSRIQLSHGWNNTVVYCTVPEGVGTNLQWTLHIDDDSRVGPSKTHFMKPIFHSISDWPVLASTKGGDSFTINGVNFGPPRLNSTEDKLITNPIQVEYRSDSDERVGILKATNCQVETDKIIECTTMEGAGSELEFILHSAASHEDWKQSTSWVDGGGIGYAAPRIDMVASLVDSLPTTGEQRAFLLEGDNFGPFQNLVDSLIVNDWIEWEASCLLKNHTALICDLPEGIGDNFVWEVTIARQESAPSADEMAFSYDNPFVESVRDIGGNTPEDLDTQGDEFIYMHGDNFGPGVGEGKDVGIGVFYGDNLQYEAADCMVEASHIRVRCLTVPGVGENQSWTLNVGNQASNRLVGVSNYHPPVVATYSRMNLSEIGGVDDLQTPGGEVLILHGRHFGPPGTKVDEAVYGTDNFTLTAIECDVVDHTQMNCITAPGAGSQHFWTVRIGGQESDIATTSYEPPKILNFEGVNGSDPQLLSSMGGERVDIVGENFGPPGTSESLLESISYGPNANTYTPSECRVLSHDRIRCKTVEGHGQVHQWVVIVAGQQSRFSEAKTSYAPPKLHQLTPNHGPTGFYSIRAKMPVLTLNGTDLGANLVQHLPITLIMDTDGKIQRLKDSRSINDRDNLLDDVLARQQKDPSTFMEDIDDLGFPSDVFEEWLDDIVSVSINEENIEFVGSMESSQQAISITLPEGFGVDRPVFLMVGNTYSRPLTFSYDPPRIDAVAPSIENDDEIRLTVFGENFCGGSSCEGSSCCGELTIEDDVIEVSSDQYFHDEIQIVMRMDALPSTRGGFPKGEARIRVVDQPIQSNMESFEQPLPEIPLQQGRVQLSGFKTRGGELFMLYDIKEISENHDNEDVTVTIGGKECTNVNIKDTIFEDSTDTWFGNLTCITPPHMGKDLLVSLSVSGSEVPRSDVEVDYAPPQICLVKLNNTSFSSVIEIMDKESKCEEEYAFATDLPQDQRIPTTGAVVSIRGFNFGTSDFDVDPIVTVPGIGDGEMLYHYHELFVIFLPPGTGANRKTEIWISDFEPSFEFHYEPPTIASIEPLEIPTNPSPNDSLIIMGENFGPPTGAFVDNADHFRQQPALNVTVDGNPCELISSNHSYIECIPPEGQGDNIKVTVTVEKQYDSNSIRYKKPQIESISPASGPTSGMTDGQHLNVTITGHNFGTSGLVQMLDGAVHPVTYDHEQIIFFLPEGYGANVPVLVSPAGWDDDEAGSAQVLFSYEPPSINELFSVGDDNSRKDCEPFERCTMFNGEESCVLEYPDCFPTSGDGKIEVVGENFGPGEGWHNVVPEVKIAIEGQNDHVAPEKDSENPHTRLFFDLPEGTGKNLLVQVIVEEMSSEGPNPNGTDVMSYDPPRISNIMPNNPDAMGENIEFRGANFGPAGSEVEIMVGNLSCLDANIREPHTLISCKMQPDRVGPKRIKVNVAQRSHEFPEWLELFVSECKRGWYGLQGELCLFCEEEEAGAICPGGERFFDKIYSDAGWWRTNDTTPSDRCHEERQGRQQCPVFQPCEPDFACLGDNECHHAYTGSRCSDCASGYFRLGGLCQSCPDHAWLLVLALCLAVVGVCIGAYVINSKGVRLAAFTIGVDYFQVIALFASTRVRWPETMERTLQALSFFNLNIELAAPECWMTPPPTFEVRW